MNKFLLVPLGTCPAPAFNAFAVGEYFKAGVKIGDRMIVHVADELTRHFGETVEDVDARELPAWWVSRSALDKRVVKAMGRVRFEVAFAHMHFAIGLGAKGPCNLKDGITNAYRLSPLDRRIKLVVWRCNADGELVIGCVDHEKHIQSYGSRVLGG
jgi:hypothetical protein